MYTLLQAIFNNFKTTGPNELVCLLCIKNIPIMHQIVLTE